MKCPCCGKEMNLDGHRKIDLFMCYECGYIEGRRIEPVNVTRFEKVRSIYLDELSAYVSSELNVNGGTVTHWLRRGTVA